MIKKKKVISISQNWSQHINNNVVAVICERSDRNKNNKVPHEISYSKTVYLKVKLNIWYLKDLFNLFNLLCIPINLLNAERVIMENGLILLSVHVPQFRWVTAYRVVHLKINKTQFLYWRTGQRVEEKDLIMGKGRVYQIDWVQETRIFHPSWHIWDWRQLKRSG